MIRVMGLDVGDKTIGVAVSDPLGFTAQGIKTIRRIGKKKDFQELANIINEYKIDKIVVGLPKNMDGSIGDQGNKTIEFAKKLENYFHLDIIMEDERLTTLSAESYLIEGNVRREKRKTLVDKIAAALILQTYLDREGKKWMKL